MINRQINKQMKSVFLFGLFSISKHRRVNGIFTLPTIALNNTEWMMKTTIKIFFLHSFELDKYL